MALCKRFLQTYSSFVVRVAMRVQTASFGFYRKALFKHGCECVGLHSARGCGTRKGQCKGSFSAFSFSACNLRMSSIRRK